MAKHNQVEVGQVNALVNEIFQKIKTALGLTATSYNGKAATAGDADTATTLKTARNINGTSFNGSSAITTEKWGKARTVTVGKSGKSVDGSADVSFSLSEMGAQPAAVQDDSVSADSYKMGIDGGEVYIQKISS